MMKLTRFVLSRCPTKSHTRPLSLFSTYSSNAYGSSSSSVLYVDYTIFKGKAALSISPILPTFAKTSSGALIVDKKGAILLKFYPAIGERKYDYEKKQCFALSATELGSLIGLAPAKSCEFFHDPSMKTSNAGQVRKSLSVSPLSEDGYFFTLTVVNSLLKTNERFTVPVTKAEFTVMQTSFSFMLPYIMGWHQLSSQSPGSNLAKHSEVSLSPNLEWNR
ncbi:hypothetical protein Scep_003000 [Stephania cephalantha]|uniref:Uncharacterized protein n=1 Tax=Stephania cephalantha TaxID=152367 RepID=A0AAP0LGH3_9MAGN